MTQHIGDIQVLEIMMDLMAYWRLNVFGNLNSHMGYHVQRGNQ